MRRSAFIFVCAILLAAAQAALWGQEDAALDFLNRQSSQLARLEESVTRLEALRRQISDKQTEIERELANLKVWINRRRQ